MVTRISGSTHLLYNLQIPVDEVFGGQSCEYDKDDKPN